ncbi:histone H1-like [Haemaphysalis longicornis]
MSEETSQVPAATVAASSAPKSPKKKAAPRGSGKPKSAPTQPKVSAMVTASIGALKERGGSSLQAIKKYMAGTYKVDVEKLSPFIRKYLKSAVASGALVPTKGKGASGSFKLSSSASAQSSSAGEKKKKAAAAAGKKKPSGTKKPRTNKPTGTAKPKRAPAAVAKNPTKAAAKKPKVE